MDTRSLTLLNTFGDLTVTWSSDKDESIRSVIEEQMKKGVRFFIIKPFSKNEVQIKNIDDVVSRELIVHDDDVMTFFGKTATVTGLGRSIKNKAVKLLTRKPGTVIQTVKATKDVDEIVSNHSVGTAPLKGG